MSLVNPTNKPAINNLQGLSDAEKERFEASDLVNQVDILGIGGDHLLEAIPNFNKTKNEKVIDGKNNTYIVLGRDRNSSPLSGYGGRGHTHSGMVDIVVGRLGRDARSFDDNDNMVVTNSNFKLDAARVYISQKSDIDEYFGLTRGKAGSPTPRSAVAAKADLIRLIAREGIKLVTGTDKKNSQGGDIFSVKGIDLIAGNSSKDLQPLVKGKNLQLAMEEMVQYLQDITALIDSFLMFQMKFNKAITTHTHISPFWGQITSPSPSLKVVGPQTAMNLMTKTKTGLATSKTNFVLYEHNYLSPAGKYYINSRHNNTN